MKTIIQLIMFVMLFAITVNCNAASDSLKQTPKQDRDNQRTKSNQISNGSNNAPSPHVAPALTQGSANQTPYANSAPQANNNKKWYQTIWDKTFEEPITFFTFLLAIFTLVLAISTIGLWIVTVRASKHTEKAANAAKDSADALPIIERAYVFVEEIMWQNRFVDEPIQPVTNYLSVRFINHGNTPAIIRKVFVLADKLIVYPISIDIGDFKIPEGIIVSSREDKKSGVISIMTSAEEIKKIREGTLKLICYGCIIYEDILRKERRTYFCWEYNKSLERFYISDNKELNYYT